MCVRLNDKMATPFSLLKELFDALSRGAKTRDVVMHFIERVVGVAPDGGSGSSEFLLLAIPAAALCYLALKLGSLRRTR